MIVLQFLTDEYQKVLTFNYLSTYISALKNYLPDTVLYAHVIQKFVKGMFRIRHTETKYHTIWDIQILLEFAENISFDSYLDVCRKPICLFTWLTC